MSKVTNRIIIVGGGKGGVGKSTVTMALVDALVTDNKQVLIIEADDSNPDVFKALNGTVNCEVCNLDNESGYISLGNLIQENPDVTIVVNTAARATNAIITNIGILTDVCKELNRELVLLWPINRQRDSLELLSEMVEANCGFKAIYAAINTYFGTADKFVRFANSKLKGKITGSLVFPDLNDMIADKMVDNRLALGNADEKLSIAERSVLGRYRKAAKEALKVTYE